MRRIAVAGYLGNQLFQWAFGHTFLINGSVPQFVMQEMNLPTNGWKCELNFLTSSCKHFQIKHPMRRDALRDKVIGKSEQLGRTFSEGDKLIRFSDRILKVSRESQVQDLIKKKSQHHIYYGYFQNTQYFREIIPVLTKELNLAVTNRITELKDDNAELNRVVNIMNINAEFMLVHVRRGDFLQPANRSFGLLGSKYNTAIETKLPKIIVTDDVVGAKDVIEKLKPICVVNPQFIDAITSLYFFTKATIVVASNSTYSYWGSLLALGMGKRVIIPSSFRPHEDDFERFYIDSMEVAEAYYIR